MYVGEKKETVTLASLNRPRKVETTEAPRKEEVEVTTTERQLVTA